MKIDQAIAESLSTSILTSKILAEIKIVPVTEKAAIQRVSISHPNRDSSSSSNAGANSGSCFLFFIPGRGIDPSYPFERVEGRTGRNISRRDTISGLFDFNLKFYSMSNFFLISGISLDGITGFCNTPENPSSLVSRL